MSGNPYIQAQRAKYDALRETIAGVQTRAAEEQRDLTEDELKSIKDQGEQARKIADEIEALTEIETRNRQVADLGASLLTENDDKGKDGKPATRSATRTQDRDPGHYRSESEGGTRSFFGDIYHARHGDADAAARLAEHNRALSTGSHGVGVVPPKWLSEEFETLARQGRQLANAVRNIGLGDDPRPMTLPKQTAGTDTEVNEQAAENDPVDGDDAYDTDVDVVTPKPTAGKQLVSRQMLDMSTPAVDQLIYGDLMAAYNLKVEKKVGSALVTAAGTAVTTFATEAAFNGTLPAVPAWDAAIDTAMEVWDLRKLPADIVAMSVKRWGKYKKLKDADGRPLIPTSTAGPVNVIGVGSVTAAGMLDDLAVIPTDGIATTGTYPESVVVLRAADTILFESDTMRFRFEEQAGPESVVLGIWGYTAVVVRQAGKSAKRFQITAAS